LSFTGNYTCDSFKSGLINGDFDFDTDTIKMALYTNSATLNEDTAAYTATGEVSASGYSAGGVTLTVEKGLSNNTAFISFENTTVSASSYCERGFDLQRRRRQLYVYWTLDLTRLRQTTFTVDIPNGIKYADALIRL
jgi:hypothetical protein